jgi:hypothetical protein
MNTVTNFYRMGVSFFNCELLINLRVAFHVKNVTEETPKTRGF